MSKLSSIIHDLKVSRGLTDELITIIIENFLKAAFKKKFGTDENAVIDIDEENSEITLYVKKIIVETVNDEVKEIAYKDAKKLEPNCNIGDQLLNEVRPEEFTRSEILVANQKAHNLLQDFEGDTLYSEFSSKQGEIVIGYYLREQNKNIIVDLGRAEGILPKKFQSPRDAFSAGDKIKALVHEVKRRGPRVDIVLTRTHKEFVKKIFELEVPELYDRTVEIVNIVREPGYRSKIAVHSSHSEIDPVGTCIGTKGSRINNIILELDGERIDILRYDSEPLKYIYHALSPAEVKQVVILDYAKRTAIAVVEEEDFSIAIGKLGLNIRLATRLTNWQITVKTVAQFKEMQESEDFSQILAGTFSDTEEVDVSKVSELTALDLSIVNKLEKSNITFIEDLLKLSDEDFLSFGITENEVKHIKEVIQDFKEIGEVASSSKDEQGTASFIPRKESDASESVPEAAEEKLGEEELAVDLLPLDPSILKKLKDAGLVKLYDLVEKYSDATLDTIETLTETECEAIETAIKENIQVEEE